MRLVIRAVFLLLLTGCGVTVPSTDVPDAFPPGLRAAKPRSLRVERAAFRPEAPRTERVDRQRAKLLTLLAALSSADAATRTCAVTDLGFLPHFRHEIVPPVSHAVVNDESKWVRRAAVKTLAKVASADAIPLLRRALTDRDRWVQHSAAKALERLRATAIP